MTKKELYTAPQVEILEMHYAERVCQAVSGNGLDDYTLIDPGTIVWGGTPLPSGF